MEKEETDYIIYDISDFAAYLSDRLCINQEQTLFLEELILDYFQQSKQRDKNCRDKNSLTLLLDPHKPTQKELELFWNN
ncbi:MAG TPA: hypothetical protein DEG06_01750 [Lachnospiraceae bacterium]|jgi:hypothetical protein|nr:hypothetical protein [Lachnospiraceae bacterium]HBI73147.1 hypothetical protein [Lachnospiraceae bacterium]HBY70941.1 hypothetical protein [Lachnospiraceae bacterium]HCM12884.1 hypothetical protein [Lachnospiraceae bacterium]